MGKWFWQMEPIFSPLRERDPSQEEVCRGAMLSWNVTSWCPLSHSVTTSCSFTEQTSVRAPSAVCGVQMPGEHVSRSRVMWWRPVVLVVSILLAGGGSSPPTAWLLHTVSHQSPAASTTHSQSGKCYNSLRRPPPPALPTLVNTINGTIRKMFWLPCVWMLGKSSKTSAVFINWWKISNVVIPVSPNHGLPNFIVYSFLIWRTNKVLN